MSRPGLTEKLDKTTRDLLRALLSAWECNWSVEEIEEATLLPKDTIYALIQSARDARDMHAI